MFCTQLDPAAATDEQIRAGMHRELVAVYCDIRVCVAQLAQEYGDHQDTAQPRMAACCKRAELLLGIGATP